MARERHRGWADVSNVDLISISDSATAAFGAFDWTEHEGKGVRLFVQGFG
jgi:hypothetical protein